MDTWAKKNRQKKKDKNIEGGEQQGQVSPRQSDRDGGEGRQTSGEIGIIQASCKWN